MGKIRTSIPVSDLLVIWYVQESIFLHTQNFCEPDWARKYCFIQWGGGVTDDSRVMSGWQFWCQNFMLKSFFSLTFWRQHIRKEPNLTFLDKKCSYFGVILIIQYIFKPKCNCRMKSMQEKESVMVVWCKLKIPSRGITVWTVTLVTEFSIRTSLPLKILIVSSLGSLIYGQTRIQSLFMQTQCLIGRIVFFFFYHSTYTAAPFLRYLIWAEIIMSYILYMPVLQDEGLQVIMCKLMNRVL